MTNKPIKNVGASVPEMAKDLFFVPGLQTPFG